MLPKIVNQYEMRIEKRIHFKSCHLESHTENCRVWEKAVKKLRYIWKTKYCTFLEM